MLDERYSILTELVCENIGDFFKHIEVELYKRGKFWGGACPIHCGDNCTAISIYPEGYAPGYWVCRTHSCDQIFKKNLIGFVRGVLSQQKLNWSRTKKMVSFTDTINCMLGFLGMKFEDLDKQSDNVERKSFLYANSILKKKPRLPEKRIDRALIRKRLIIPAEYYVRRGYTASILNEFDIGYCPDKKREMYNRAVCPVYDDHFKFMVGCIGRSIYDQCKSCNYYHGSGSCPASEIDRFQASKWRNQSLFSTGSCLYNYWNAKKHIQKSKAAILVEGPGDILRLEEAGIHNGLATFGVSVTDEQQVILETSGAMKLIVCYDQDKAGQLGIQSIRDKLGRIFNLEFPELTKKDIGDMEIDDVRKMFQ